MNKKILIVLALVVVAAVLSVSQLADSTVLKSTKSHKWGWNKNSYGGYSSEETKCKTECATKTGTWCGPHWNSRYYCCDTPANCLAKDSNILGV